MSRLKLPGRLPGRLHESVATAALPLDCHLVKQVNLLLKMKKKQAEVGLLF